MTSEQTDEEAVTSYERGYGGAGTPNGLYLFRHHRRWTQRALAERAGLTQETVSRIERGHEQPRVATKTRLAAALGAPVEVLFPEGDE